MDVVKIEALVSLLSTSVTQLKKHQDPSSNAEFLDPSLQIVAAASQLIALVRTPERYLLDLASGHLLCACLRTVVETNVPEIIREFGKGPRHSLDVSEIGALNQVNPSKIARVLRLLATHHVFEEVSPNIFANNTISIAMDTGKLLSDLKANPIEKYDGTDGVAALVGLLSDDSARNSGCLSDTLKDPATTNSFDPYDAPFSRAWVGGDHLNMYDFLDLPENLPRRKRFQMAMNGINKLTPPNSILRGFDWSRLPSGSIVIDCGGGIGSASLPIVQANPQIHLVVQDMETVVAEAQSFWQTVFPSALVEGRVSFQAQNLLSPQPSSNHQTAVYLLRMVLHTWPDAGCIQILDHLRQCIGDNMAARVVIVDNVILYACRDQTVNGYDGGLFDAGALAPEPLLANWGTANSHSYKMDVNMLGNHNACERTLPDFAALFAQTRFRIVEVHQAHKSWLPQIVAAPI